MILRICFSVFLGFMIISCVDPVKDVHVPTKKERVYPFKPIDFVEDIQRQAYYIFIELINDNDEEEVRSLLQSFYPKYKERKLLTYSNLLFNESSKKRRVLSVKHFSDLGSANQFHDTIKNAIKKYKLHSYVISQNNYLKAGGNFDGLSLYREHLDIQ